MADIKLRTAQKIVSGALKFAREKNFKPLAVAVYDARGALKAYGAEDGTSLKRGEIAMGKATGALALGISSRALAKMAAERPHFVSAAVTALGGAMIPVPGGVLLRDKRGELVGAVGISGDTSDNDELAAVAGAEDAGLTAETGA
jgi:uncharacterized protein GlcG (DUF336 family)